MAESPGHKFGQIIGDLLEEAFQPVLQRFADEHGLFLDKKGERPARKGKKVTWTDSSGNKHDLDFVLEREGTPNKIGVPVAFIETAWRRYTKHSRNKVQEIQGALSPLSVRYRNSAPFLGAILAGVFTEGALKSLESNWYGVLYFSYQEMIDAFRCVGIDAAYDEDTSDLEFKRKIRRWEALSKSKQARVSEMLRKSNTVKIQKFMATLNKTITRRVVRVVVIPLHGRVFELASVKHAVEFVMDYDENNGRESVMRYEVQILYSNADKIHGEFSDKKSAIRFLQSYG